MLSLPRQLGFLWQNEVRHGLKALGIQKESVIQEQRRLTSQ